MLGYFKYAGFFARLARTASAARSAPATPFPDAQHRPADRHLVLHVQLDVVHDRHLPPRRSQPAKSLAALRRVRLDVPAPDRRADRALLDDRRQLRKLAPRLTSQLAASGLFFFACGLVKKLLIADTLAPHVDRLFARHDHLGLVTGWAAAVGYSLQLYFDFSGYSDMAVGLAFLLGFRFPQNFNSPYKSVNISRLLAALAHVALVLAARLPVHPAGRVAQRALADAAQPGRSRCSWAGCGTARRGRSSSGACCTGCFLIVHNLARDARPDAAAAWP